MTVLIDLDKSKVDMTIGDRRTLRCFAAFLRHASAFKGRQVPLHEPWHEWLTGSGPCPDPASEVGPSADG